MRDKDLKYTEISDELMNSLRDAYLVEKEAAAEECPMSETAISYAARELDPEEHQKFEDHLHTCRFCLDLVLDVRVAVVESTVKNDQPSKVFPALSKALRKQKNSAPSESHLRGIKELFSKYCFPVLSPKFISGIAVGCLATIMINFGVNNPDIIQQLQVINKNVVVRKKIVSQESKETQPTIGRIDEIGPVYKDKGTVAKKKKRMKRIPQTPLESLDLSQLKLVGIVLSDNGNKALLEDSNGKGYMVSKGTYVVRKAGKIIQIEKDRIVIEEEF